MNSILQLFLLFCLFVFLGVCFYLVSRKQLNLKYTLLWLFADFCMIIVTVFPQIVNYIGMVIGIDAPVNTVFLFNGMFIILILLSITIIVSHLKKKIFTLTQAVAVLEKRVREISHQENE